MLQPYDLLIAVLGVLVVVGFIWWRLGMPGWRRGKPPTNA
jgi:hypothetical protein